MINWGLFPWDIELIVWGFDSQVLINKMVSYPFVAREIGSSFTSSPFRSITEEFLMGYLVVEISQSKVTFRYFGVSSQHQSASPVQNLGDYPLGSEGPSMYLVLFIK